MKTGWVIILSIMVSMLFLGHSESVRTETGPLRDESIRRGEMRATMAPEAFSDPYVRKAYQIAKEIPWVLDSIYCYCKCEESPVFRHKSLLSCYVDTHASM
jgi:hypothetical protein